MSITASSGTYKVDTVEQANIGGTAITKVIAHMVTTGTSSTGWALCDENGKFEFQLFGGTAPAVGDTMTFSVA